MSSSRAHVVVAAAQPLGAGLDAEPRCREIAFALAARDLRVTVLLAGGVDGRSEHRFGDVLVVRVAPATRRGRLRRVRRSAGATTASWLRRRGLALRTALEEAEQRRTGAAPLRRRAIRAATPALARLRRAALGAAASSEDPLPGADFPQAVVRALAAELAALRPDAVHAIGSAALRAACPTTAPARVPVVHEAPGSVATASETVVGEHLSALGRERARDRRLPAARLLIGPRNGNGQAAAWARAAAEHGRGLAATSLAVAFPGAPRQGAPADLQVAFDDWGARHWQQWWAAYVASAFTHVVVEAGDPVLGRLHGEDVFSDLPFLAERGLEVGLVFRGSELRDPRAHAKREPYSPFRDPSDPLTARLQERVDRLHARLGGFEGPCFVTTLDLLDDLPRARWLPHALDLERWTAGPPVLERRRPVVVHAPTRASLKGTRAVDAVCEPLAAAGHIEYRRLRAIPFDRMPEALRAADVVIDQLVLGAYGAVSLQGMATGRLVVANVSDRVRGRLDGELPIVQATPDTLGDVLTDILADRPGHGEVAGAGREHVERLHSGRCSAERLLAFVSG